MAAFCFGVPPLQFSLQVIGHVMIGHAPLCRAGCAETQKCPGQGMYHPPVGRKKRGALTWRALWASGVGQDAMATPRDFTQYLLFALAMVWAIYVAGGVGIAWLYRCAAGGIQENVLSNLPEVRHVAKAAAAAAAAAAASQ